MRKLNLFAVLSLSLLLSACGGQDTKTVAEATTVSEETTKESSKTLEVDKGLLNVEVTIPSSFFEGIEITQEDLDSELEKSGFKSAKLNDDGSVTYVMSKSKHEDFMKELSDSMKQSLQEMIDSEDYSFTKIDANDTYSKFVIHTTAKTEDELSLTDSFSVMSLYYLGGMYNAFNGTTPDSIKIEFVNNDTGEIICKTDSSNLETDTNSETEADSKESADKEYDSNLTMGQKNALKKADSYLSFSAFSKSGLISQLEYEGFPTEEATFAAENCGADWNEQAAKKAENYLSFSSFSYEGLIGQLEFDGFTPDESKHGADSCGADWNEQAAKKAKTYLDYSSFSRDGLIKQLKAEKFTQEQAEYGVSAVGY